MIAREVPIESLEISSELARSGSSKVFEERLRASIDEIGLSEPLKVASQGDSRFVVIDGAMRLRSLKSIHERDRTRFRTVPVYVFDYSQRYEIRFQSDIYQDLLPSQLATLVEHLHNSEHVLKVDIARYIGVAPTTLRNYTGLARLLSRGGRFAQVVELMDAGVFPSSNPFAWLRLTVIGVERALQQFAAGAPTDEWIAEELEQARRGMADHFALKHVETVTSALPSDCYRVGEEVRTVKRDLGLRRNQSKRKRSTVAREAARKHVAAVATSSDEPVLQHAARSLMEYLR